MLCLNRRKHESIILTIGDVRIEVYVSNVRGNNVRLSFDAPREVKIMRKEIQDAIDKKEQP